jgi:uridine kinase
MTPLDELARMILERQEAVPADRAMLVAISGIDGSGKGFLTEQLATRLAEQKPIRVATINIDGWLHLPQRRFSTIKPAEHFYEQGFRFAEMFVQIVLPLRNRRTLRLSAELADATNSDSYRSHDYEFEDIDLILLEGIFLLKRSLRGYYDFTVWVNCSFETAFERALHRGQEGLPPEQLRQDYDTIYFAAQRIHFDRDQPQIAADATLDNDAEASGK